MVTVLSSSILGSISDMARVRESRTHIIRGHNHFSVGVPSILLLEWVLINVVQGNQHFAPVVMWGVVDCLTGVIRVKVFLGITSNAVEDVDHAHP
jgi:hypothetical protein